MRIRNLLPIGCALLLAACSSADEDDVYGAGNGGADNPDETVMDDNWEVTKSLDLDASEIAMMLGMNDFGYRLMASYADASADGGFNVSPVSVGVYLAMMANAVDGDIRSQILQAMDAKDLVALNGLGSKLMHHLPCADNGVSLAINNRLWVADRYTVPDDLQSSVKKNYNADVESVDFGKDTTVPAINRWVSDKTAGRISGILHGDWSHFINLSVASANTVYFKGDWDVKFDKGATRKESFKSPSGILETDMMHIKLATDYSESDGVRMVRLYYKNQTNVMELYLPSDKTPAKDIAASITPEIRKRLDANAARYTAKVSLPRFKSSPVQTDLNDVLGNMGLTGLYAADFAPLGIDRVSPLVISHQTFINVDEEGTELAAVTGGYDLTQGPVEYENVSVDFDRPFMYVVRNCRTDAILMAGVVTAPGQ